jgi:hypothetical protein
MNNTSDAADARPVTIAFVNCFDATTFGRTVHLTPDQERRLRNVLAALRDYGFVLEASFEPVPPGYGFADVADHLRATIGPPIADAALAAAERSGPSSDPAPAGDAGVAVRAGGRERGRAAQLGEAVGRQPAGRGAARRGRRRSDAGAVRARPVPARPGR